MFFNRFDRVLRTTRVEPASRAEQTAQCDLIKADNFYKNCFHVTRLPLAADWLERDEKDLVRTSVSSLFCNKLTLARVKTMTSREMISVLRNTSRISLFRWFRLTASEVIRLLTTIPNLLYSSWFLLASIRNSGVVTRYRLFLNTASKSLELSIRLEAGNRWSAIIHVRLNWPD
jgi:hypothetical protein